jgi:competence protein ComEA
MHAIETSPGPRELAGARSRGRTSPARRGEGPKEAPAASRSLPARIKALRHGIWAPVLVKALGLALGMLALAAIGASSLARGSGVAPPPPSAHTTTGLSAAVAHVPTRSPEQREPPNPSAQAASDAGVLDDAGATPGLTADGKVILNLAGASDLRRLPGVGAKRAEAILALRAKLGGRFKRITDLLRVKGIGPKGIKKIEARAVLDAPK